MLFGSGYAANSAVAATLPLPNDTILFDERSHNSTRFGLKRSRASLQIPFAHNDLDDLRVKLRDHEGVLIFVEGIYSMDGDEAPLLELAELCLEDGRAGLIVDEAHSTGILGDCGRGAVSTLPPQLRRAVVAQVHTFGKALGGHGAVVVCDATTREYLANYAQPFVYATAPPDSHSRLARRGVRGRRRRDDARRHLARLIDLFRAECDVGSLLLPSRTPIQAVLAPGADVVSRACGPCPPGRRRRRVLTCGGDPGGPTVPAGARRWPPLVLHAFNTEDEVAGVARAVSTTLLPPPGASSGLGVVARRRVAGTCCGGARGRAAAARWPLPSISRCCSAARPHGPPPPPSARIAATVDEPSTSAPLEMSRQATSLWPSLAAARSTNESGDALVWRRKSRRRRRRACIISERRMRQIHLGKLPRASAPREAEERLSSCGARQSAERP